MGKGKGGGRKTTLATMDAPSTAIEQYFNQLINMRLLSQVVVSDRQGNTIVACFGNSSLDATQSNSNPLPSASLGEEEVMMESNVVLSGARCFQNLEQLQAGTPSYISAQYHDAVVVQTMNRNCLLTLVGSRAQGHFVGGLLSLLPQIRATPVYVELENKVEECFQ